MKDIIPKDYGVLLNEIKQRIRSAQYEALKTVNKEMISLYWDIGGMIVERQKGEGRGKSVVEHLARDLQAEFPGIGGFSASNLWRIKLFHETYAHNPKLAPMVREIGWSHNIIIIESKSNLQALEKSQIVSAKSEAKSKEPMINKNIYVNNELKRTRTNSNCMSSFQFVPVRCLNYLWNRTRMTRIGRMFTDPRASASSAQSVFQFTPSAFIGIRPRLIYRTAPAER